MGIATWCEKKMDLRLFVIQGLGTNYDVSFIGIWLTIKKTERRN